MTGGETRRALRIGRESIHTYWDNSLSSRLSIEPGATVEFETVEASYGRIARNVAAGESVDASPELLELVSSAAYPEPPPTPANDQRGHPLTGPVTIAGAEPGDTLEIEVVEVRPGSWGWTGSGPTGGSPVKEDFTAGMLHLWDLRNLESAEFLPGIRVPLTPFCGVMGVAPKEPGRLPTSPPGVFGGNLDVRQLSRGAVLRLPVQTPGALFSTGDAHGAQGDGEIAGTGIECDATVTLRFSLVKQEGLLGPEFIAHEVNPIPGPWYAVSRSDAELYEASKNAIRGVLEYLEKSRGIPRQRGLLLASACVDLKISQIVNSGVYTVSAFLPLSIFT